MNERSSAGQCLSLCRAQSCNCAVYKACPANKDGLSLGEEGLLQDSFVAPESPGRSDYSPVSCAAWSSTLGRDAKK